MARTNSEDLLRFPERRLEILAHLLSEETARFLVALGADGARPLHWPLYETQAKWAMGGYLGELLVHGLNLARARQRRWPIRAEQAVAVFDGLIPALPAFARPSVAARATGVYHIHLRGGPHYTLEVKAGDMRVDFGRPQRAQLHVSADPLAYLLVGYGRVSRWSAPARGKILAWGTRPWLALRLANLIEQP